MPEEERTSKQLFWEKIGPLIGRIETLAQAYSIPYVMAFQNTDDVEHIYAYLSPERTHTDLKKAGFIFGLHDKDLNRHTLVGVHRAALIYPCSTGVLWECEVGGIMIDHPLIEGMLLPIPHAKRANDVLLALHPDIHDSAADCLLFKEAKLQGRITAELTHTLGLPLTVIDHPMNQEAWLLVQIEENEDDILADFVGEQAFLAWENCD